MDVVLDVTPPALRSLTISGKLSFADNKDLELTTEWIMLHGELEIGTEAAPHTHKATITLTDNVKGEDFGGLGGNDRSDRGIMLMGGTLTLLVRHVTSDDVAGGRARVAALYGINTAGAALGCVLTDFTLVPARKGSPGRPVM